MPVSSDCCIRAPIIMFFCNIITCLQGFEVRVSSDCCIRAPIIKFFCNSITCIPGFEVRVSSNCCIRAQIIKFVCNSITCIPGFVYVYLLTAVSELKLSSFSVIALHVFQGWCACIFRLLYQSSNYQVFL